MKQKIEIKKVENWQEAFSIAEASPDYFNELGLREMKKELPDALLYGAHADGKVIGFIAYKEFSSEVVEITWFAVHADFRNQGIGSALLNESLKDMAQRYRICKLKTLAETGKNEGYARTRNFYKKHGFISIEIIDPYPSWDPDNPCQIFVKIL